MNAKTTETLTWIDTLPAIPLARGVPVIAVHDTHPGRNFKALPLHAFRGQWTLHDGSGLALVPESDLRADLSNAQGFGYALRWLAHEAGLPWHSGSDLVYRHLHSATTDADRLALARAIAEVS